MQGGMGAARPAPPPPRPWRQGGGSFCDRAGLARLVWLLAAAFGLLDQAQENNFATKPPLGPREARPKRVSRSLAPPLRARGLESPRLRHRPR